MSIATGMLSDLDALLNGWDTAVVTINGFDSDIKGIFDKEYLGLDLLAGTIESAKPAFVCKTSDVANITHQDTIIITSELYSITNQQFGIAGIRHAAADIGPGLTRLILKTI